MYEQGDGYRLDVAGLEQTWLAKSDGWTRMLVERTEELISMGFQAGNLQNEARIEELKDEVHGLEEELKTARDKLKEIEKVLGDA